ncbi:hypothetical protein K7432_006969 [Basidiobolus ranarum]|uniref:P-loop containing nucleoside triphosphate hydrolase protein n=1 Tax=Basidiobolus ranarum TaxID=34480 RepID=A0ABR2WU21_9FUNG
MNSKQRERNNKTHGNGRSRPSKRRGGASEEHKNEGFAKGPITPEMRRQITERRHKSKQISTDATDDLIVASAGVEDLQHFASMALRKGFSLNSQRSIRRFVNSCLMNLSNHHNVDTSGILLDLASNTGVTILKSILLAPMSVDAGTGKLPISFQYIVLPFIGILTRETVCRTTMVEQSNVIFSTVFIHAEVFILKGVLHCMDELLNRRSFRDFRVSTDRLMKEDPSVCIVLSFGKALLAITRLVFQLLTRIRSAPYEFEEMVDKLYMQALLCNTFPSDYRTTDFENEILMHEVKRLRSIIRDAKSIVINVGNHEANHSSARRLHSTGPNLEYLERNYDPPGAMSKGGPRHNNDKMEISEIAIIPTEEEIACEREPFLPSNGIPHAPHFIEAGWKRQLDIQFRLYREDMLSPLRKGITAFLQLLEKTPKSQENVLLQQATIRKNLGENVNLNVYGDVQVQCLSFTNQQSVSVQISFAQPSSIANKSEKRRQENWERSKNRLMQGGLVCLLSRPNDSSSTKKPFHIILGVISERNILKLAKDAHKATITISLTNTSMYLMLLNDSHHDTKKSQQYLLESPGVFFESYRPILQALQKCTPATLPFGKYIAPKKEDELTRGPNDQDLIGTPSYTRAPGFKFDLSVLLKGKRCNLHTADHMSRANATNILQNQSTLDDTQAKALVETLCREVALIRGPPGAGKTKIGVDLMRVLLHNKAAMNCGPILCVCYTNHALDQFLEHLLDEGVKGIVRVGGQSKSERLADLNLNSLSRSFNRPLVSRKAIYKAKEDWKITTEKLSRLDEALKEKYLPWEYLGQYLLGTSESHYDQLNPFQHESSEDEGFSTVKSKDWSPYQQWITGTDISNKEKANKDMELVINASSTSKFELLGDIDASKKTTIKKIPIPSTNRPLELLEHCDVWNMSRTERTRLHDSWKSEVQELMLETMQQLLQRAESINKSINNAYDEVRRLILKESTVIGMTTNGAARFQTLVASVAPNIIICEEAGEVLESHILATLSPSTQHLILIGDHHQLRPQIATYKLSSDSHAGKSYNLDKSLFERLVTASSNPLPMSELTTQRRMRPEISSLIRNTRYPDLIDGKEVLNYPNVSGMSQNVYFMDHGHPEDSKDQYSMQSFSNSFEVKMVEALAQYLIKNGYNQPGDIAVLTPYLGQLSKLRDALKQSFMLVIDERDQDQLDLLESNFEDTSKEVDRMAGIKQISMQRYLTLRTIDNYQGEEAKIVIISLVRNNSKQNSHGIGFLKSPNRSNVLLSRAQHGMFILGNASLLSKRENGIWPKVIEELRENSRLGPGFPIMCKTHPNTRNIIDNPEILKIVAPHGGCNIRCNYNMACGHVCPLQCTIQSAIRMTKITSWLNVLSHVPDCMHHASMPVRNDVAMTAVNAWRTWALSGCLVIILYGMQNAGKPKTHYPLCVKRKLYAN